MESESSDEPKGEISEYEKHRLLRIAENKARIEALLGPSLKHCGKSNSGKEEEDDDDDDDADDDYRPDEADCDEEDEDSSSHPPIRNKNDKKTVVFSKKRLNKSYPLGEYGDDLNKAIALSLLGSEAGGCSGSSPSKRRRNDREPASLKKELMSKMQITEDELVIYFYQFDEAGKGFISLRDVVKMATAHDFTWTQDELQNMIGCFDIDRDGKLSLDEFRKIVRRCRMLKES